MDFLKQGVAGGQSLITPMTSQRERHINKIANAPLGTEAPESALESGYEWPLVMSMVEAVISILSTPTPSGTYSDEKSMLAQISLLEVQYEQSQHLLYIGNGQ